MLAIVSAYIEHHQLLPEYGEIIVAFSGGADSLCLLHLLHQLCGPGKRFPGVTILAAHLDHQLRAEASAQDAAAVSHIAGSWGIPVTIGVTDVPALARKERRSLEDAARVARYSFLREVAHGRPIAVAHHKDDQLETLLLHWLRGGGIASMVGLQPRQQDIIRPLLAVTHADTLAYCQQHKLVPLEDASNVDPRFLRNRIRHELIPLLTTLNPAIRETVLRNAEAIALDVQWIEAQVDASWTTVVISEENTSIQLDRKALLALPRSLQRHLLRRVTARLSAGQSPLEQRHYTIVEELVQREQHGEMLTLDLPQHLRVGHNGDTVYIERQIERRALPVFSAGDEAVTLSVPGRVRVPGTHWTAEAEFIPEQVQQAAIAALRCENWAEVWRILPANRYAVYIDADCLNTEKQKDSNSPSQELSLIVRTRQAGDRIQLLGMAHEKKVQDVLVDRHISRAERAYIPLFFSPAHCLWLAGVELDERARLNTQTRRIVRLSISQGEKNSEQ